MSDVDPLARRAVLERRRAGGVGREGAADERARERRRGRIVPSRPREHVVELDRASRRPPRARDRHRRRLTALRRVVLSSTSPIGVAPPVSDDCAPIGRTRRGGSQDRRDFGLGRRREQRRRMTAGKVRGVLEMAGDDVAVANGDRVRAFTARRAALQRERWHVTPGPAKAALRVDSSVTVGHCDASCYTPASCRLPPSTSRTCSTTISRTPRRSSSSPLMAIHYAHLVMLAAQRIISSEDAHALRMALDSDFADARFAASRYDGSYEDLFFYVERLVAAACGDDVAGRLHTARSRNDIDMTMYRMRQREFILGLMRATLDLRRSLLDLADRASRHDLRRSHAHAARPADDGRALPSRRHRTARARRHATESAPTSARTRIRWARARSPGPDSTSIAR